jgi:hypothetical protein
MMTIGSEKLADRLLPEIQADDQTLRCGEDLLGSKNGETSRWMAS